MCRKLYRVEVSASAVRDAIVARLASARIPGMELLGEPHMAQLVQFGTLDIIEQVVESVLADGEPTPPAECRHVARLAARNGVPLQSLTKAYRIGHAVLQSELLATSDDPVAVTRRLFDHVDAIIDVLVAEYTAELDEAQASGSNAKRLRAVRDILFETRGDQRLDFYHLGRRHTAVVAAGPAAAAVARLAERRRGVVVEVDEDLCWAWFGETEPGAIAGELDGLAHVGIGGPASGIDGFRRAHREAAIAVDVARVLGRRLVEYGEASIAAIALNSRPECRALVANQLGELAADTARHRELRATLHAYLRAKHNNRTTAAALNVSERTVTNRLAAIRRLLPATTALGSTELALAIHLATALGRVVSEVTDRIDSHPGSFVGDTEDGR